MARPMKPAERHALISRLVDEFEARGWREDGYTALAIAREVDEFGPDAAKLRLATTVPRLFLVRNEATLAAIAAAVDQALT
jgi:hypothetical protein